MKNIGLDVSKIISNSRNLLMPSILVGGALIYFFSITEFSDDVYKVIHNIFIISVVSTLLISLYLKVGVTFVCTSISYIGYIMINNLRYIYGEDYIFSSGYNIWIIMLPINMFIAYIVYKKHVKIKEWSWLFVFLLIETYIIERLYAETLNADSVYFYKHIGAMNYPSFIISIFFILVLLNLYILKGNILLSSVLFSTISILLGVFYSDNLTAFSLFFLCSVVVEFLGAVYYVVYISHRDEDLNIPSYNMYFDDAQKKYPLKYSVAVLYIDEYDRILKRFGKGKVILLKKMFFNKITQINKDVKVYNYKDNSFILAFTRLNVNDGFIQVEEIRRNIAKSIFVFNENNHLQLSVSLCISEKKRSDADADEVLIRAEEGLKKACKFTHNITVKA